mmetsp:Transcript_12613/g.27616  ORF Transcript_12613/g.27616 Transcript_12613/m.27616 type:complete len:218 (+) Transcript_12613:117-770(+)
MSLRFAPRLLSRHTIFITKTNNSSLATATTSIIPRRTLSTPKTTTTAIPSNPSSTNKMSREEIEQALEKANEQMKAYYSYPPDKVVAAKKARFNERHRDNSFYVQLGLASSLVCAFLLTPFVGRKIAQDEEFKNKYIPSWYDYTIERPKSAWTKEELHEQMVAMQRQLHERAIKGEFTPEKLEEMRRNFNKVRPEKEEHAHFAKLHPGVDDDEELED